MALWVYLYSTKATPAQWQAMAGAMWHYTPLVAIHPGHGLALNIHASLSLFKGPLALLHRIRRTARTLKNGPPGMSTGMAPTESGAALLAGLPAGHPRHVIQPATLARRAAPLPLDLFPAAQAYLPWLHSLGCHTLGQLLSLPRAGLQQRTSPAFMRALDALFGRHHLTVQTTTSPDGWFVPHNRLHLRHSTDIHITHAPALLAQAAPLVEQACQWLFQHQLATHCLLLRLLYHPGRHAHPASMITIRRTRAGWLPAHFMALLEQQLPRHELADTVVGLELFISHTEPRRTINTSLFPTAGQQQEQESHVFDLLRARLGHDALQVPAPQAHYLPEQANHWSTACAVRRSTALPLPVLPASSRPFWLLPQPVTLAIRSNRPCYQGTPLFLEQGPERIESGWWQAQGHQQRDYFVAHDTRGTRYWIYRQRHGHQAGVHDPAGPVWFLHGIFA
ncbi:MAG: DNA polymerase Y family protein [Burkholderiaceae bacterium]